MGYQALLFCPDEKTARTVTQVLSELEFNVEACTEPFAAVKKLMGQHFDAVVVDCDNEQNATLLFKSARNSSSNQTSLAVAVVEGQAGVAKAFRIGANLVLTKPINIEQAKGTLRVARGLLRKSEPAKTAAPAASAPAPAATPAPAPLKPAAPKPISAVKAAPQVPSLPPRPVTSTTKPAATPAWPAAAGASSKPADPEDDPLDISLDEPAVPAPAASATPAAISQPEKLLVPPAPAPKPAFTAGSPVASGGAASAPAPARIKEAEPVIAKAPENPVADALFEKPAQAAASEPAAFVGSSPSFSFGGANAEPESGGGNKKILLGVAAAVVVAVVGYVGWSQFGSHASHTAVTTPVATPAPVSQPVKPSVQPAPVSAAPATTAAAPDTKANTETTLDPIVDDTAPAPKETATHSSGKPSNSASPAPAKTTAAAEAPETAPLVVKGGKAPAAKSKAAAADAPAPSMIGMATPGATAPPPDFSSNSSKAVKPVLQQLNVSQGVSQGLLMKKVAPSYPPTALHLRIQGAVELLATISKEGTITHIKVLSGDSQLTKAASDAVKQWKYKPYLLNGEPVEIQTQITVNFRLPN